MALYIEKGKSLPPGLEITKSGDIRVLDVNAIIGVGDDDEMPYPYVESEGVRVYTNQGSFVLRAGKRTYARVRMK